ncbi:MAG: hypothetical protein JSS72_11720 [Armatimonadetes bacterium]|nr:hypothetical protein [Armatimonadota bacterium]
MLKRIHYLTAYILLRIILYLFGLCVCLFSIFGFLFFAISPRSQPPILLILAVIPAVLIVFGELLGVNRWLGESRMEFQEVACLWAPGLFLLGQLLLSTLTLGVQAVGSFFNAWLLTIVLLGLVGSSFGALTYGALHFCRRFRLKWLAFSAAYALILAILQFGTQPAWAYWCGGSSSECPPISASNVGAALVINAVTGLLALFFARRFRLGPRFVEKCELPPDTGPTTPEQDFRTEAQTIQLKTVLRSARKVLPFYCLLIAYQSGWIDPSLPLAFNSPVWKNDPDSGLHNNARDRMMKDLLANHLKSGMTIGEVEALLGRPDADSSWPFNPRYIDFDGPDPAKGESMIVYNVADEGLMRHNFDRLRISFKEGKLIRAWRSKEF